MAEYPRSRNPGKGKYCEKHHRWAINIAGKLKCRGCYDLRVARKREKLGSGEKG